MFNHKDWKNQQTRLLLLASGLYLTTVLGLIAFKWANLLYNGMDLAIINQVFFNTAQGNWFASSIHPASYLGDHFSPIILVLMPAYWLFPHPLTLLILQTLALIACAWILFFIAKKELSGWWPLIVGCLWLLNPFVLNINVFEFSLLPLALVFYLLAFYFYRQKKLLPFLSCLILCLLVREDLALATIMFFFLALVERKKFGWWFWPLGLSLIYFFSALKLIGIFAPADNYKFIIYYSWLGSSIPELAINFFLKPHLVLLQLLRLGNWEVILGLLLPLFFIPILAWPYLLLAGPVLAQYFLGSAGGSILILQTHYCSLPLAITFIAFIYGIKNLPQQKIYQKYQKQYGELFGLCLTVAVIYSFLVLGPAYGLAKNLFQTGLISQEAQAGWQLIKQLPKDAALGAGYRFLAPLANRADLASANYIFLGKQQFLAADYALPKNYNYLLLDLSDLVAYQLQYRQNPFYQKQYESAQAGWAQKLEGFSIISWQGDYIMLKKKSPADEESTLLKNIDQTPADLLGSEQPINEDLKFLGYQKTANGYQIYWQISRLKIDYHLEFSYYRGQKVLAKKIYPLAYYLLPQNKDLDQIVAISYPKALLDFEPNRMSLDLIDIKKGGLEIDGLRSTQIVIDEKTVIAKDLFRE